MTEKPELQIKVNPDSRKAHQKQLLWQIIAPLVIVVALALALVILIGFAETGEVSVWADILVIFLVTHVIIASILLLLIIGIGVFALGKVIKGIPQYTLQAQEITIQIEKNIRRVSDGAAKPFVRMGGVSAALQAFLKNFHLRDG